MAAQQQKQEALKKNLLHATVYIKHFKKLLNYLELSVFYRITLFGVVNTFFLFPFSFFFKPGPELVL